MYEILIEHRAERDLNKLPSPAFSRIAKSILTLKKSPRSQNARKIKGSKNDWRLRVGDYRVIYEIDDQEKVVRIFRAKHRKEVYRYR